jgi:hypothetical protein
MRGPARHDVTGITTATGSDALAGNADDLMRVRIGESAGSPLALISK